MKINQEARTALSAAWVRAYHLAQDDPPWIFEDSIAHRMLDASEVTHFESVFVEQFRKIDPDIDASELSNSELLRSYMRTAAAPAEMLSRSRYAEDLLAEAMGIGVAQYVILGAGMDTFALRNRDHPSNVFEVDRAGAQAFKKKRLAEAGFGQRPRLHFVAVDFTKEHVDVALRRTAFDPAAPAFFSWLGVTMYLSYEAIVATLHAIRKIAATGSHVVFDYLEADAFDPDVASKPMQALSSHLRSIGEPLCENLRAETLRRALTNTGFSLNEDVSPQEIDIRYFQQRTDGYHATEHAHFVCATVD